MGLFKKKNPDSPKKPFGETGFGKFINKVKEKAPEIAMDALEIAASGQPIKSIIGIVRSKLNAKATQNPHDPEYIKLVREIDEFRMTWEKEVYALEIEDRKSARNREIEIAKTGKTDWLMLISGFTALGVFVFIVISAVYKVDAFDKNPVLHQIVGMVEGVTLSIFMYYFGSSKGSADKTRIMASKVEDGK